jgi:sugar lactone lactonase YvrE
MVITATVLLWCATVAWPCAAALSLSGGGQIPQSFRGASVLGITLLWSLTIALVALPLGWIAGRAIRNSRAGVWILAASVMAAALPTYAVFWTWWQAMGPGTMVGDWAAHGGHADGLRVFLLGLGLASWVWPVTAWCVAAQINEEEHAVGEQHQLDRAGLINILARMWRSDWPGLTLGFAVTAFVIAGSTVAFDLAQVPTFGFELRTLDVQATPAGAVMRAALPAIALAALGAIVVCCWPVRRPMDMPAPRRPGRWRGAAAVVVVSLVLPVVVLMWALISQGALATFGPVALRGAMGTLLTAGGAGAVSAAVAVGHMLMAARGRAPDHGARAWRITERVLLGGWLLAALVPGTVYALALTVAFNVSWTAEVIYDTPAIVVLAEVGRYGAMAAIIGRVCAVREPQERQLLRLSEGGTWNGMLAAMAPHAAGAALAAGLAVAALGAGEVVVTARIEPPGWDWAAGALLNAIHYQQPDAVLGTLLALGVLAAVAALVLALGLRRIGALGGRLPPFSLMATCGLMALMMSGGCRQETETGQTLQVVRWFGASGAGPGLFQYPRVLELDHNDGTVIVIDRQARVHRFSPEGRFLGGWQLPEFARGKPTGLAVAHDGTLFIADTHYHRVLVYSPEGNEVRRWGEYGTDPGQFIFPCDVAIGPDGLVYVAEFGSNDRIQVFSPDGAFVRQIGKHGRGPGEFDRPQSLKFNAAGDLFVADACNHRIQVLDSSGNVKRILGRVGREPGQLVYPYGLELLSDGTLLVAEFGGNRIQRLDATTGASLDTWHDVSGAPPPAAAFVLDGDRVLPIKAAGNVLRFPWSVAWRNGEMFVLDSGHSRVLVAPVPLRVLH